jgi:hypothetical protein
MCSPQKERKTMPKAVKEFEAIRRNLLRRMSRGAKYVERIVHFQNNDVPDYLKNLSRFEEASKKTHILVR